MAQGTFFKTFSSADRTTTRTLLHEAIPLTGAIVSGTYNMSNIYREKNIKAFSHGMFQSIYDYPYLSSSANHIFDITVGCTSDNSHISSSTVPQIDKKVNIYNQLGQTLVGYDTAGNIRKFDPDGSHGDTDKKMNSVFFLNFSRLLVKDEIKKGSFKLNLGVGHCGTASAVQAIVTDTGAATNYHVNSPAGEYGILYAAASDGDTASFRFGAETQACGLLFYQAGIAVLTSSVFINQTSADVAPGFLTDAKGNTKMVAATYGGRAGDTLGNTYRGLFTGSTIDALADGIRNKIINISFNNTTELNSTIYFCRANHNEFNYSSNPTYLNSSKIRVKGNDVLKPPRSYVTTVGLYSADNELLAVAKLSEPLRKDPTNEVTLRVRLDY